MTVPLENVGGVFSGVNRREIEHGHVRLAVMVTSELQARHFIICGKIGRFPSIPYRRGIDKMNRRITIRILKKDAPLNGWFGFWRSNKLIKISDHFEALENLFHLAPIWYLYLFSLGIGISLSEDVAKFVFAVLLKKMQFSKIVSRTKDNLKIFKIIFSNKIFYHFLSQFYQQIKGCVFFLTRVAMDEWMNERTNEKLGLFSG